MKNAVSAGLSCLQVSHAIYFSYPIWWLLKLWSDPPGAPMASEQMAFLLFSALVVLSDAIAATASFVLAFRKKSLGTISLAPPMIYAMLTGAMLLYPRLTNQQGEFLGEWVAAFVVATWIGFALAAMTALLDSLAVRDGLSRR